MRTGMIFFAVLLLIRAEAQTFGGHPPVQRWKQIRTDRAWVIFPTGWDSTAKRAASLLNAIESMPDSASVPVKRAVPVILQHRTTISNGYVGLAPFRSEWLMTPPVNPFTLGSLPWADQLGIHEYRHIQQYQQFNRGGAKLFRWILGEQGQALANALTIPDWYFEGEAVFQETRLSKQGRGRLPAFYNGYRALWEADRHYSYQKLRNGSYRDYVPGHYQLGQLLTSYGYDRYGRGFWKDVTNDAAAMRGVFYPFQQAVRRYSGESFKEFTWKALDSKQQELAVVGFKGNEATRPVVNEENPVYTEAGDLVYMRSSYTELPAFTLRKKDGTEKKIRVRDQSLDNYFSYANGKIVYTSWRPAARWGWIDYSELQVLDIVSGRQQRITVNSNYFTPAFSHSADSIVAVHIGSDGLTNLHVLDLNGRLLNKIPNDSNFIYSFPVFAGREILTATRNRKGEMALQAVEIETGLHRSLVPWTRHIIGYPKQIGDTIYFTLSINGRDQTVLLDKGKMAIAVADNPASLTGEYQPTIYADQLTVSKFTAGGYKLRQQRLTDLRPANQELAAQTQSGVGEWLPVADFLAQPMFEENAVIYPERAGNLLDEYPADSVTVKNYSKASGLFRFHSWMPWYEEPEFSLTVVSQNLLNTFQSQVYGLYNRNEQFKQIGWTGTYGGLFPLINAGIEYTFDRRALYRNRQIRWNEMELKGGLQIPLNLSRGRQISFLTLASDLVYNKPYFRMPEKDSLGNRSFTYLDNSLRFSIQSQQAKQHINPRWATALRLQYRATINRYDSKQWLASASQYLPGIGRNHSLVLSGAIGGRDSLPGIRFSDNFPFARGYESRSLYRMSRLGATYHFPLFYPDAGAWNIVYLLRVRAAGFFDWARAKDERYLGTMNWVDFRSTGLEFYFDTRWWNQLPVSVGLRYAYLLDSDLLGSLGRNHWEIILPINLIPSPNLRKQKGQQSIF